MDVERLIERLAVIADTSFLDQAAADDLREAAAALAKLQAERDEALSEVARRDAVAKASWGDQADEHTDAIRAAHPTRTKQYETWDRALAMVGKRHGKYELVDLVNWLLVRAEYAEIRAASRAMGDES